MDSTGPKPKRTKPLRNPTRNLPRAVKFGLLRQVRRERWAAVMLHGTLEHEHRHRLPWSSSATRRRDNPPEPVRTLDWFDIRNVQALTSNRLT